MSVPRDQSYNNFRVPQNLTCGQLVSKTASFNQTTTNVLIVPGGQAGDFLVNTGNGQAAWSADPIPVATICAGVNPTGMAITSDGTRAYVANNNNYAISNGHYVSLLDLTENLVLKNI